MRNIAKLLSLSVVFSLLFSSSYALAVTAPSNDGEPVTQPTTSKTVPVQKKPAPKKSSSAPKQPEPLVVTSINRDIFPKDAPNKLPETSKNIDGSSGSFSQTIPIAVPSYYGIEPSLALSYNSSAGNGIAGVGWSLSGWSTIERKGPNHTDAQFDETDAYYLNGEELIPCASQYTQTRTANLSPSCTNAAQANKISNPTPRDVERYYATRNDSFVRIERTGGSHANPSEWTVWRKDGTKAIYGAKCITANGKMSQWALSLVTHQNGARTEYNQSVEGSDPLCSKALNNISYHGGKVVVQFSYNASRNESRPDLIYFSDGYGVHALEKLLTGISVQVQGQTLREYTLSYSSSPSTRRSLLTEVKEKNQNGESLPPTKISWTRETDAAGTVFDGAGTMISSTGTDTSTWLAQKNQVATGDFNGDGLTDFVLKPNVPSGSTKVAIANANGSFFTYDITTRFGMNGCKWSGGGSLDGAPIGGKILTGDFNGDKRTDILIQPMRTIANGDNNDGWSECPDNTANPNYWRTNFRPWLLLGKPSANNEQAGSYFSNALDLSLSQYADRAPDDWDSRTHEVVVGDFNGDQYDDLWMRDGADPNDGFTSSNVWFYINVPTYAGKFVNTLSRDVVGNTLDHSNGVDTWIQSSPLTVADFNGDGKTDLLFKGQYAPGVTNPLSVLLLSRRLSSVDNANPYKIVRPIGSSGFWADKNPILGDFNGDGLTDLWMQGKTSTVESLLYINGGLGNFEQHPLNDQNEKYNAGSHTLIPGDFNGDGRTDLLLQGVLAGDQLLPTDNHLRFFSLPSGLGSGGITLPDLPSPLTWSGGDQSSFASNARRIQPADFIGDGRIGLLARGIRSNDNPDTYLVRPRTLNDLIEKIETPLGGVYEIEYTQSSRWEGNDATFPNTPTVKTIKISDGIATSPSITEYSYKGGKYDTLRKKSLGFQEVTIKLPRIDEETNNPYVITKYNQSYEFAGMPNETTYWAGNPETSVPLVANEYKYCLQYGLVKQFGLPDWYATFPVSTKTTSYNASGVVANITRKQTAYDLCLSKQSGLYGTFGNLILDNDSGIFQTIRAPSPGDQRVTTPGGGYDDTLEVKGADNRIVKSSYLVVNTGDSYRVDRVASQKIYAGSNVTANAIPLSETQYSYYGDADGDDVSSVRAGLVKTQTVKVKDPITSVVSNYIKRFDYDAYGNLAWERNELCNSATDMNCGVTQYKYDSVFHYYKSKTIINPTTDTSKKQVTAVTEWNYRCGAPTRVRDPNDVTAITEYDSFCRVKKKSNDNTDEYERIEYIKMDAIGLRPGERYTQTFTPYPAGGEIWKKTYVDGLGRTLQIVTGSTLSDQSILTTTAYNARGLVETATLPRYGTAGAIHTNRVWYDGLNRPIKTQYNYPTGATQQARYEAQTGDRVGSAGSTSYAAMKVTYTDEEGHLSSDLYDARGSIVQHADYLNTTPITATTEYDLLGNIQSVTDPLGNVIRMTFDARGLMRQEKDPDRGTTIFAYDDAGRIRERKDAKGQKIGFEYDFLGRITKKQLLKTNGTAEKIVTLKYDEPRTNTYNVGKLTTMTDDLGSETYSYDALGKLKIAIRSIANKQYTISYQYDRSGRLAEKRYPNNRMYALTYDSFGRLLSVSGAISAIQYDAASRPIEQVNTNTTKTIYRYDEARGWLTNIETKNTVNGTVIQNLDYSNRDTEGTLRGWGDWVYEYDSLHRLTVAKYGNDLANQNSEQFVYNIIGNITKKKQGSGAWQEYNYPTSGANVQKPHAVTTALGNSYDYDTNGNMVNRAGDSIEYTVDNLPKKVTRGTQVTSFAYDGNGARIAMTAPNGETTLYLDGGAYEIKNNTHTLYIPGPVGPAKKVVLNVITTSCPLPKTSVEKAKRWFANFLSNIFGEKEQCVPMNTQ